jgi:hypothetical protein
MRFCEGCKKEPSCDYPCNEFLEKLKVAKCCPYLEASGACDKCNKWVMPVCPIKPKKVSNIDVCM